MFVPLFFIFMLGIDILTKYLVFRFLPQNFHLGSWSPKEIPVFRGLFGGIDFSITHVVNYGGAWGMFSSMSKTLLVIRIVVVLLLGVYLFFLTKQDQKKWPLFFVFIGAIGNILDSFFYGHVIDMLHFTFWGYSYPVFNIADSLICIGFALLFFTELMHKKKVKAL